KQHSQGQKEPGRLVEGRGDTEIKKVALLVPDAAVVARHYAKAVVTRREVRILHLAVVDHLKPIPVQSLELVAEAHLLRNDQAQRRVINRHVPYIRGQKQLVLGVVGLAVDCDLFDVHRRWDLVEWYMARIDHADAVVSDVPDSPIRSLGCILYSRNVGMGAHTVRDVEQPSLHQLRWIVDPGVQLGLGNPYQAASRIGPDEMVGVVHAPVDRVTRYPILARECRDAVVLDAAQPVFSGDPQRATRPKSKAIHLSCPKPMGGRIRLPNRSVCEVGDPSTAESQPDSVPRGVGDDNTRIIVMPQRCPANFLHYTALKYMKEPVCLC